jgi:hypothetical protein
MVELEHTSTRRLGENSTNGTRPETALVVEGRSKQQVEESPTSAHNGTTQSTATTAG